MLPQAGLGCCPSPRQNQDCSCFTYYLRSLPPVPRPGPDPGAPWALASPLARGSPTPPVSLSGSCFPREAGSASTCSPGPGEEGGGVEVGRGGGASRQRSSQSEASHRVISTHHHGLVLRSEFRLVFPTAGAGRRPSQALVMVSPYGGQLQGFSVLRSKAALPGTS